jgi:SAM-dependent methyltransferase
MNDNQMNQRNYTRDSDLRHRRRETFDGVADLYDRARPGYPEATLEDLLGELPPGSRILEIGCGTGQLTAPIARRGYTITAVELGDDLARVARRNLAPYPNTSVVTANFEIWTPRAPFDLVVAATSVHWINPVRRAALAAAALRSGGTLAILDTKHVAGGTEQFFIDMQPCYLRYMPGTPPNFRLPTPEAAHQQYADVAGSALFELSLDRAYLWDAPYTTTEYIDVLSTYSDHLRLPSERRAGLLACIAALADRDYGGRIVKRYQTTLTMFRLRDGQGI